MIGIKNETQFKEETNQHRNCDGNKPSTILIYNKITPKILGKILAIFEHRTFAEGLLWNVNSFDQWGVEHGKNIAQAIHAKIVTSRGESHRSFYDSYGEFI